MIRSCAFFMLAALGGCRPAAAVTIDSSNDVHCSALAFQYAKFAEADPAATPRQKQALKQTFDWYSAKVREAAIERNDPERLIRESGPALKAAQSDPAAMRAHVYACAERASADPAFRAQLAR
jgi:hypothetical protein